MKTSGADYGDGFVLAVAKSDIAPAYRSDGPEAGKGPAGEAMSFAALGGLWCKVRANPQEERP